MSISALRNLPPETEVVFNIWYLLDVPSSQVLSIVIRPYMMAGSVDEKADQLRRLAFTDYLLGEAVVLKRLTTVVGEGGTEENWPGVPLDVLQTLGPFRYLAKVVNQIESDLKRRFGVTIPAAPFTVTTCVSIGDENDLRVMA
ncbi:MAG: hypothetical protein LW650_12970 [Planctomycetaceae bacterium]|jgi:hypothetical protein|nr:hypothetical protein [Phycisphaerales bacterium]MCE2654325.1 hypothetical protein [Planctomycetaceae bacterium]